MADTPRGQSRIELLQGTLDFIILRTHRWGPQHGLGLAQLIKANSSNTLRLTAAGRKRLVAERTKWERMTQAIAGILNPPLAEGDS